MHVIKSTFIDLRVGYFCREVIGDKFEILKTSQRSGTISKRGLWWHDWDWWPEQGVQDSNTEQVSRAPGTLHRHGYKCYPRTILPPHTPHFIYFNPADTLTSLNSLQSLQSGHRIRPSPVRLTEAGDNPASTPASCLTDPEVNIRQWSKTISRSLLRSKFVNLMSPLTPRPWWTQSWAPTSRRWRPSSNTSSRQWSGYGGRNGLFILTFFILCTINTVQK